MKYFFQSDSWMIGASSPQILPISYKSEKPKIVSKPHVYHPYCLLTKLFPGFLLQEKSNPTGIPTDDLVSVPNGHYRYDSFESYLPQDTTLEMPQNYYTFIT